MQTQLIIDNESRDAHDGRTFERRNPLTGDVVTEGAAASVEDAIDAVESASKAFSSWSLSGPSERRAVMLKAADIMERRTPEFVETMMSEVGAAQLWAGFNAFLTAQSVPRSRRTGDPDPGRDDSDRQARHTVDDRAAARRGRAQHGTVERRGGARRSRAIAYPIVCGNTRGFPRRRS